MKTTTELVREVMERGEWVTPFAIQSSIRSKYGVQVSDSAITARIRELRRAEYGNHIVNSRLVRKGSKAHEYQMVCPGQQLSLVDSFPHAHLEVLICERELEATR